MISALRSSLEAHGFKNIEVDEDWSARQRPYTARGEKALGFGEMDYHFYPTMLRWVTPDGRRRLMWLPPEIDTDGPRPRLNHHKMMDQFFSSIVHDTKTPATKAG